MSFASYYDLSAVRINSTFTSTINTEEDTPSPSSSETNIIALRTAHLGTNAETMASGDTEKVMSERAVQLYTANGSSLILNAQDINNLNKADLKNLEASHISMLPTHELSDLRAKFILKEITSNTLSKLYEDMHMRRNYTSPDSPETSEICSFLNKVIKEDEFRNNIELITTGIIWTCNSEKPLNKKETINKLSQYSTRELKAIRKILCKKFQPDANELSENKKANFYFLAIDIFLETA